MWVKEPSLPCARRWNVMNRELLSHETAMALIERAQTGDGEAMDILVQHNLGLVKSLAVKFINRGVEFDDLLQIGTMGLIRAIQKFDLSYDVRFSTYAVPMIVGEIKRYMRDNGAVKVARSLKETAYKAMKTGELLKKKLGREASIQEISDELSITVEDLITALDAAKSPVSLDEKAFDEDSNTSMLDNIRDDRFSGESMIDRVLIKEMLSVLPKRDRQLIVLRYFQDKTQTEVAKVLNISQVQVSRLESKILKELKKQIS